MRLDVSMLRGSRQWAFPRVFVCSLAVIDVGRDANAAGHGIIFRLEMRVCVYVDDRKGEREWCVYVCVCVCVFAVARRSRKVPCQISRPGLRLLTQKNVNIAENEVEVKCVNGLVWELPLCQKQLVRMRSRERGLINYLHILDWRSC